ncbi:hypothetical protein VIGAN_05179100 [Vigna angularis var. angularis]|uniref:Uncharacterized protein n=1 Tax=Vigna angularis var. angularis TaxID=157739 RepID=A0A0S3S692_PHAAN|nr:hypothetical protein VIGAN_05179100 [Vigna angularis var. angularis]
MASSNSSSSTPVVASSYPTTSVFKFGSSPIPSTSLPLSSSGLELLETKRSQDAGAGMPLVAHLQGLVILASSLRQLKL